MISPVTAQHFHEIVNTGAIPVLVDFFTDRCSHCRELIPVLEDLAAERAESLRVVKFNAGEDPAFASQFRITSVPNLILFQDGLPIGQRAGFQLKRDLEEWIDFTVRSRD